MIAQNNPKVKPQTTENLLKTYFEFSRDYGTPLKGRLARSYRLASDGQITQIDANTWTVTAATNGRPPYTVRFNPVTSDFPGWTCDCPDCGPTGYAPTLDFAGGVQPTCKHIAACALAWAAGPPAAQPRNGRYAACPECKLPWQQCNCKNGNCQSRQPAKVTTLDRSQVATVADQRKAARAANGIKQEGKRRIASQFENVQRW